jgi:SulP family sulfate permease
MLALQSFPSPDPFFSKFAYANICIKEHIMENPAPTTSGLSRLISRIPAAFTPILATVLKEGYSRHDFLKDFLSGIIVGIVALPLAIAFGIASGVTPAQGMITAILGGFITAFLGGSRAQVSGPTGAFIVIIYGIIQKYGYDGLATATLIAGVLLIGMGLARFGGVLQFIPFPVIVGFTSGIALIIATGQIPSFLGLVLEKDPADWVHKIGVYAQHLTQINLWTVTIAVLALLLIMSWPKFSSRGASKFLSRIPGSLVAILVTTALAKFLDLPILTIGDKYGVVPSTIPLPHLPSISFELVREMFSPAMTIAMLAGIESLLSAVVADGMTGHKHRPNMELVAQGVANIVSPLFGGIPSTGAIARTATNIRNGGRSPVSGIVHAIVLLLIMLFIGKWAALIPMATLAAILLVVAYNMSEWRTFVKLFKAPKSDLIVLLLTFALTVIVDLTVAIQVGVVAGAILFIRRMAEVTQVNVVTKSIRDDDEEIADPMNVAARAIPTGVIVYEVYGSFFFGAVEKFNSILSELERPPKVLIIRMRAVLSIDSSGLHFLEDMIKRCEKEKVRLILSGVHMQPTIAMTNAGLIDMLGDDNFSANIDQALTMARNYLGVKSVESPIVTQV